MDINNCLIEVTPAMAVFFMGYNTDNRKKNENQVRKIATDILDGKYATTHQGIAMVGTITSPVRLIDGQKRLQAIIDANKAINIPVYENVPALSFRYIDDTQPRTIAFRLHQNAKNIAVARALMRGSYPASGLTTFTASQVERVFRKYRDLIESVQSYVVRSRRVGTAPMIAGVIRAIIFYKDDADKTKRIYSALESMKTFVSDSESGGLPIRFYENLKSIGEEKGTGATIVMKELYHKTEWFFDKWCKREKIPSFRSVDRELFPNEYLDSFMEQVYFLNARKRSLIESERSKA